MTQRWYMKRIGDRLSTLLENLFKRKQKHSVDSLNKKKIWKNDFCVLTWFCMCNETGWWIITLLDEMVVRMGNLGIKENLRGKYIWNGNNGPPNLNIFAINLQLLCC